MTNPRSTRYDREPAARIALIDSKSRIFWKELPADLVALIIIIFEQVKARSGPFPDDWLIDALQLALASRAEDELLDHPNCFEAKVPPQEAVELVVQATTTVLAKYDSNMSPYLVYLACADVQKAVVRSLMAYAPR